MATADPYRVFEANATMQKVLQSVWPDLYDALARVDKGKGLRCSFTNMHDASTAAAREEWPEAVGRIPLNGRPACQGCVDALLPRQYRLRLPHGFPLQHVRVPGRWLLEHGLSATEEPKLQFPARPPAPPRREGFFRE